jgi:selenocysteine lyase/cysteine desulfurase
MAANHDLAIEGRRRIAEALGVTPRIPAALHGSMAIVPLPIPTTAATAATALALKTTLMDEDRIEVPITAFPVPAARLRQGDEPVALAVRISAQRYNEASDYERLAEALVRRLGRFAEYTA